MYAWQKSKWAYKKGPLPEQFVSEICSYSPRAEGHRWRRKLAVKVSFFSANNGLELPSLQNTPVKGVSSGNELETFKDTWDKGSKGEIKMWQLLRERSLFPHTNTCKNLQYVVD